MTANQAFEKVSVGKGQMQKKGMDITRLTLKMEERQKLVYEFEIFLYLNGEL